MIVRPTYKFRCHGGLGCSIGLAEIANAILENFHVKLVLQSAIADHLGEPEKNDCSAFRIPQKGLTEAGLRPVEGGCTASTATYDRGNRVGQLLRACDVECLTCLNRHPAVCVTVSRVQHVVVARVPLFQQMVDREVIVARGIRIPGRTCVGQQSESRRLPLRVYEGPVPVSQHPHLAPADGLMITEFCRAVITGPERIAIHGREHRVGKSLRIGRFIRHDLGDVVGHLCRGVDRNPSDSDLGGQLRLRQVVILTKEAIAVGVPTTTI